MPEVFLSGAIRVRSAAKRGTEPFEILPEEANIAAHDAKVRNLLSFNPKVNRLRADPEKSGGLPNIPRDVIAVFVACAVCGRDGRRGKW